MSAVVRVAVIGGGLWGTALANAAAAAGRDVVLWMRDGAAAAAACRTRRSGSGGFALADRVAPTAAPAALADADACLVAVPAQATRSALAGLRDSLAPGVPLVLCAKGIERGTGAFQDRVATEAAPGHPVAILSGPGFAGDVARGLPTAVVLAAADGGRARALAAAFSGPTLRVYHGTDLRGVAIGGAAKNVLAIAAGIVEGRGLGDSAKAALVARGFAELLRFAAASGARSETLMGLSGLGDVVLSCGSARSRNFDLGRRLGAGDGSGGTGDLAEGAFTAEALLGLARAGGVQMPVAEAVADLLAGRGDVGGAIDRLLSRPLGPES